jgi:adenylyltransferase and sulfurtransferase
LFISKQCATSLDQHSTDFDTSLNSKVEVRVHNTRFTPLNARQILCDYNIVLDCTDNAPTRYLLSDTCVELGKPLVSGAALRFDGQLCVYNYDGGPCYRCLFPKSPTQLESCEASGVLGPVTGVIGTLQALEAIKIITNLGGEHFFYTNYFV